MGVGRETVARPTLSLFIRLTSQHIPSRTESNAMEKDHHIHVGGGVATCKVPGQSGQGVYIRGVSVPVFQPSAFSATQNISYPNHPPSPETGCAHLELNRHCNRNISCQGTSRLDTAAAQFMSVFLQLHFRDVGVAFFSSGTPAKRCMCVSWVTIRRRSPLEERVLRLN